jgi:VCBS repeat-containing protein
VLNGYENAYKIITELEMFNIMGVNDVDVNDSLSLSLVSNSSNFTSTTNTGILNSNSGVVQLTSTDIVAFGLTGVANVGDFFIYSIGFDGLNASDVANVSFNVQVSDGTAITTSTVSLTVDGVNDAPVISATTEVNGTFVNTSIPNTYSSSIIVADINASDVDNDTLTYSIIVNPLDDSQYLSINSTTGIVIFSDEASFNNASASALNFQVKVTDGNGGEAIYSIQSGAGIDGYITNMTVFSDANANGVLDASETSDLTNTAGEFTLSGGDLSGVTIGYGGIDISTGLAFEGIYKAPSGSTILNPVTTLLVNLMAEGKTLVEAMATVKSQLGITSSVDLLADPIASALSSTGTLQSDYVSLQMMNIKIDNTIGQIAAAFEGANIATEINAYAAISTELASMLSSGLVNLDSSADLNTLITNTLNALSGSLTPIAQSDIVTVILNTNTAITNSISASLTSVEALEALAKVQIAAESVENELEEGVKAGDTSTAVSSSTGTEFAGKVAAAQAGLISKDQAVLDYAPISKDILIELIESQLTDSTIDNTTLTVAVDSDKSLAYNTSDLNVLDTYTFARSGTTLGLTITTASSGLVDAFTNNNISYIRDVALEIVSIPEIATALASVTNVTMLNLIAQLQAANSVHEIAVILTSVGITPSINAAGLSLTFPDASILESKDLITIDVASDGSYTVSSPLFNNLGVVDNVTFSFDYKATDSSGLISDAKTVSLSINGTNDAPVVTSAVVINVDENQLDNVNNTTLTVAVDDLNSLNNFVYDLDVTDDHNFNRLGNALSLTITTSSAGLVHAFTHDNLDYIRDVALKIVSIPEIATALASVTNVTMLTLIAQLQAANSVHEIAVILTSVGITPSISAAGLSLTFPDASILESKGLITISMDDDGDGSYSVSSPLFNNLGITDTVSLSFAYLVTDSGNGTDTGSVTINIKGSNDVPTISNVSISTSENALTNSTMLEIDIDSPYALNNFTQDIDVTDDFSFEMATNSKIGFTLETMDPELLTAFQTNNVAYIKSVALQLLEIPEVAAAMSTITDPSALLLINSLNNATSVAQLYAIVNSIPGVSVTITPTGLSLSIEDAIILVTKGLLSINIDGNGSYTVESALFDNLSVNDQVSISFDYVANDSGGATSEAKTITVNIQGSNDAPTVNVTMVSLNENDFSTLSGYENAYKIITELEMFNIMGVNDVDVNDSLTLSLVTNSSNFTSTNSGIDNATSGVVQLTSTDIVALGLTGVANVGDFFIYSIGFDGLNATELANVSFDVQVSDGTAITTSTISLTVDGVNDAPVANVSATILSNDVSYVGQLVANDADLNDTLTYTYDNTSVSMTLSIDGLNNLDTLVALNNVSLITALTEVKAFASSFAASGNLAGLLTLSPSTIVTGKVAVSTLLNFLNTNSDLKDEILALKDFITANQASIIANTSLLASDIVLLQSVLTQSNLTALGNLFDTVQSLVSNPAVVTVIQTILADNNISAAELSSLSSNTTVQTLVAQVGSVLTANSSILGLLDIPTIISKLQEVLTVDTVNGEISATVDVPTTLATAMIALDTNTGEYTITNPYLATLPANTQVEVNFDYTVTDTAGASDSSTAAILITSENVDKMSASLDDEGTLTFGEEKEIDMSSLLSNITSNINVADIDSIDLSNNEHILSNLTIMDFQEMVSDDSSNTLAIKGENNDIIKLDPTIWLKDTTDTDLNSVVDNSDDNFVPYKATGTDAQVLTLLIDKDIIVQDI